MAYFFISLFVACASSHSKKHDCIHDKIEHRISQQFVKYHYPSFSPQYVHNRNLLQSTAYQAIRIRPYYDPTTINSVVGEEKVTYIKALVSSSIHYLEQFVNVIPIDGPLFINRCQRIWHQNQFTYSACPLSDYSEPLQCQYATIPDEHMAESWYYDPLTLKSYLYKPAGSGITDADLVIYVSYSSNQCSTDGSTLAWASICTLDQYGRPISGTINFCPSALNTKYWKFDAGVTLHEIMHILAMSNTLFPYFYNWNTNTFYGDDNVVIESTSSGFDNTYIVTEKVKNISREHFACSTLSGAPLENTGAEGTIGSHWESKHFHSELMCGTMYSAVLYLSEFTFALMEDTGWYSMDYKYADRFTWGQNEGCAFFSADCISKETSDSNFDQFWCTESADDGCSYDYSTIAQCINQHSGFVPSQFKYYAESSFAGPQSHDYCAFRTPETDSIYADYEQTCWDLRGNNISASVEYPSAKFGIDSRCVAVDDGTIKHGYCFKHACVAWDDVNQRYNAVKITINDGSVNDPEVIRCKRNNKLKWKESQTLSINIKCPNVDAICGTTAKPFTCYWGKWSDVLSKCICSVGYIGSDCSIQDIHRFAIEAATATATNYVSPQYGTGICITNSDSDSVNGYYHFSRAYEGLPAFWDRLNFGKRYVYYLRYYSQWNIGISYGDLSIYAYCTQSLPLTQVIDITDCELWTIWDDINGWVYDTNVRVSHCTPTYAPSVDPTMSPTLEPTHDPTSAPTMKPTQHPTTYYPTYSPTFHPTDPTSAPTMNPTTYSPTYNPTDLPTDFPTENPSPDPTINPSLSPTIRATIYPTRDPTKAPTVNPIKAPTANPSKTPTANPSFTPTNIPTNIPTIHPTKKPTVTPTVNPIVNPTKDPTTKPTVDIVYSTMSVSQDPTADPTSNPSIYPTDLPITLTINPTTSEPTNSPTISLTVAETTETSTSRILQEHTISEVIVIHSTPVPTRPRPEMMTFDSEDPQVKHVLIINNSTGTMLVIAITTFVGTCGFMMIGFLFVYKYYIKPRFTTTYRARTSTLGMASCSVMQSVASDEEDDDCEDVNDADDTCDYIITTNTIRRPTAFSTSHNTFVNIAETSDGENEKEGQEKVLTSSVL